MDENVCPIYPIASEKSLKNSKLFKECMGSLTFLPPFSFAVSSGCYFSCSFVVVYLSVKGHNFSVFCPTRLPESNMFLVFVVEQVILHMLTSFLFVNGSGFEAKLSVKALVIMWVTVIG